MITIKFLYTSFWHHFSSLITLMTHNENCKFSVRRNIYEQAIFINFVFLWFSFGRNVLGLHQHPGSMHRLHRLSWIRHMQVFGCAQYMNITLYNIIYVHMWDLFIFTYLSGIFFVETFLDKKSYPENLNYRNCLKLTRLDF